MVKPVAANKEAARLHYIYCDDCKEYASHTVRVPSCSGNCGLIIHDDPNCPMKGQPIKKVHTHHAECYDC